MGEVWKAAKTVRVEKAHVEGERKTVVAVRDVACGGLAVVIPEARENAAFCLNPRLAIVRPEVTACCNIVRIYAGLTGCGSIVALTCTAMVRSRSSRRIAKSYSLGGRYSAGTQRTMDTKECTLQIVSKTLNMWITASCFM